jgi:hypothetical protein
MTRSGTAFRRPSSVPPIYADESLSLPTPSAVEYGSNQSPSPGAAVRPSLSQMARKGMWPTPTASDGTGGPGSSGRDGGDNLRTAVWATPTAHPRTHTPRDVDHGEQLANQAGGPLNPTWVEWLMGFPPGWTALELSATPSSPKSPNTSDG